jgi:hypothetical protein
MAPRPAMKSHWYSAMSCQSRDTIPTKEKEDHRMRIANGDVPVEVTGPTAVARLQSGFGDACRDVLARVKAMRDS